MAHVAADGQRPVARVDRRYVEVDKEVVEADRGYLVAQRLERHRVVADRQLELARRDVRAGDQRPGGQRIRHLPSHSLFNPTSTPQTDDARDPLVSQLCKHLFGMAGVSDLGLNRADPATLVVDLNCAFASIEQQHDPRLRNRPLAIAAHATDAATIVSAPREARDLGIMNRMRRFEAQAIWPSIAVAEPNPPPSPSAPDPLLPLLTPHRPPLLRMSI